MPNWTANAARLTPTDEASRNLIAAIAAEAKGDGNIFQLVKPCPQALVDTVAGFGPGLEGQHAINIARYGFSDWYAWRIEHWGTKWDACNIDAELAADGSLVLYFDTAWSPPVGVYVELHARGVSVRASYAEAGVGFLGAWIDGQDHEGRFPDGWIDEDGEENLEAVAAHLQSLGADLVPAHLGG